jgi:hypothetical protein
MLLTFLRSVPPWRSYVQGDVMFLESEAPLKEKLRLEPFSSQV